MQLVEIDPNKKYVMVMPKATREFALELHERFNEFKNRDSTILAIFGTDVSIIPADQVVGYHLFEEEEAGWVTEPGWRYCDGRYAHVCKPNQAPVVICDWLIGFISCPKCSETLSFAEARRLADECES